MFGQGAIRAHPFILHEMEALADEDVERGLDILVVNAGHQQFRESVEEVSDEDFDATFKTNVYALHYGVTGGAGIA